MSEVKGQCFCGSVRFTISGEPLTMGYCHCKSCRHWIAGPLNSLILWKTDALTVTKGKHLIGISDKTRISCRKFCMRCGGHIFSDHPPMGLVDVYASVIPALKFRPAVHVNYSQKVLTVNDGLPKMKDFPMELGGSGEALPD